MNSHFSALIGMPGAAQGEAVAGRDLAGIGEAGLQRRARLAIEHHDLVPSLRQIVGGR